MSNIGLTIPQINCSVTYAARSTGDTWPDESDMGYGFGNPLRSFSSPVCDELRITANYSTPATLDRAFISTMNIVSGLSFSLDIDGAIFSWSQDTETYPERRQSQIHRFTETSGSTVVLTITGIGNKSLNLGQIVFGKLDFTPTMNIQNESEIRESKTYTEERTRLGFIQRLDNSARAYNCSFLKLTDSELGDLRKIIDVRSNSGFVLFELDQSSNDLSDHFLCYSSLKLEDPKYIDFNSATMRILEAYARG